MRSYAISTMFLAFVLVTGACAGRQARTRSIPAPSMTESTASATAAAPEAEAPVAVMAPIIVPASIEEQAPASEPTPVVSVEDEPELTTQQKIDRYVAAEIAAHNAAVRAAAERLHRTPVPPTIENNDEIVAALKFDPLRVWSIDERAAEDFAAMMRTLDDRVSKLEAAERASRAKRVVKRPRPKPKAAPAAEEGGREAVIGSLASVAPVAATPAAPAAPSVILAPQTAGDAGGARAAAAPPLYLSDRETVVTARDHLQIYAIGALLAALMGAVGALVLIFFRNRSLAAIAADAYEALPDGAVVVQEISGGRVVATNVILPGLPSSRSEPEMSEEEKQKMMDDQEETFLAAGDAMQEEAPSPEPPVHDRFDYSDTPIEGPEPSIPVPEASSEPKPPDDETPRFASGSGQLIASTPDAPTASGVIHAHDPPKEPRSEPEVPKPRIIYEDDSSHAPATTAASN